MMTEGKASEIRSYAGLPMLRLMLLTPERPPTTCPSSPYRTRRWRAATIHSPLQ